MKKELIFDIEIKGWKKMTGTELKEAFSKEVDMFDDLSEEELIEYLNSGDVEQDGDRLVVYAL
ncbi:MAG: hypothetical protein RRY99_10690 [Flavobacterium sp.]